MHRSGHKQPKKQKNNKKKNLKATAQKNGKYANYYIFITAKSRHSWSANHASTPTGFNQHWCWCPQSSWSVQLKWTSAQLINSLRLWQSIHLAGRPLICESSRLGKRNWKKTVTKHKKTTINCTLTTPNYAKHFIQKHFGRFCKKFWTKCLISWLLKKPYEEMKLCQKANLQVRQLV